MSPNDSSKKVARRRERGRTNGPLPRIVFATLLVVGASVGSVSITSGQTPSQTPAAPQSEPTQQQQQPGQPSSGSQQQPTTPTPLAPEAVEQQLQIYPSQQPGRPSLVAPTAPPTTTIPPWTPPVPPAPSQTNVPAPFPFTTPVPGGAPSTAPAAFPGLTVPGVFSPSITTFRGGTFEFHPTLRLSEEYSDNFFQTPSHSEENFRSIFGPGFLMLLRGARTFGLFSTTIDLVHDTAPNSGDEVKVFPSLTAAIRYALTPRLYVSLSDTFVRNDQPSSVDLLGIRRGREIFDSNTLGLSVDWLLDRVATQAYYRNVLFFNESSGRNATTSNVGTVGDSVTHILGVNASTPILTVYTLRGGYEFSRTDTTNGSSSNTNTTNGTGSLGGDTTTNTVFASLARQFGLFASGGVSSSYSIQTQDDTKIWNGSIFGAYGLPNGLSLSASVGYSLLNSDTQDNSGTVSARANASYRFNRAFISIGVFQDFVQTAQQGQNFGTVESRSYFGDFLYQFTPFLSGVVNVVYTENKPTGTGNTTQTGSSQNNLTYGATVNWQVLRWLTASLRYAYTKQTGNGIFNQATASGSTSGNFAENRATLNLFMTF